MSTQRWIAHVEVDDDSRFLSTKQWLKENRPLDEVLTKELVVVDARLGYAIGTSDPSSGGWPAGIKVLSAARDVEFRIARNRPRIRPVRWLKSSRAPVMKIASSLRQAMQSPLPYGVQRLGGWPECTGAGVRVAVLDSGIGCCVPALPRMPDHSDFASAELPGSPTHDMGCHGTNCAGVIGAHPIDGVRQSVAPECTLLAGQITCLPRRGGTYTSVCYMLSMATWAVENGARIINLSFCADEERALTPKLADTFSRIVCDMRSKNVALVFAAAEEGTKRLIFPADAPGVIAVGKHARTAYGNEYVFGTKAPALWAVKNGDFLFGPGEAMPTFDPDGRLIGTFDNVSCACAFVSGAAALYMQQYPHFTVDQILDKMKTDAVDVADPRRVYWPTVRFP